MGLSQAAPWLLHVFLRPVSSTLLAEKVLYCQGGGETLFPVSVCAPCWGLVSDCALALFLSSGRMFLSCAIGALCVCVSAGWWMLF